MSHDIAGRKRRLIQYYPKLFYEEWQEIPHPVWVEMIQLSNGYWMRWTGEYRVKSSECVSQERVLRELPLPDEPNSE